MSKKNPKKWHEVYAQGTSAGNDESKFFKAIARNPRWEWRSVTAISKESGLSEERVEEIIQKYYKLGLLFNNPKNEEHWGYWERVPEMLDSDDRSIADQDKDHRIDDAMGCVVKSTIDDQKNYSPTGINASYSSWVNLFPTKQISDDDYLKRVMEDQARDEMLRNCLLN